MKRPKINLKYVLIFFGLLLVVGQFFKIDKTNPPIVLTEDFIEIEQPPADIADRLQSTCYDCHAHTTAYPWYTDVAPVSWWVKRHINLGREKLNFSIWGQYSDKKKAHKIEECIEYTEKGWMPLGSYTWMHPKSKMSVSEREALVAYFQSLSVK